MAISIEILTRFIDGQLEIETFLETVYFIRHGEIGKSTYIALRGEVKAIEIKEGTLTIYFNFLATTFDPPASRSATWTQFSPPVFSVQLNLLPTGPTAISATSLTIEKAELRMTFYSPGGISLAKALAWEGIRNRALDPNEILPPD